MSDEEQIAETLRNNEATRETERARTDAELAALHTNEQALKAEETRWLDAYAKSAIDIDQLQERMAGIRKQKDVLLEIHADIQERIRQGEAVQAQQATIKQQVQLAKQGLPILPFEDRRAFLEAISFKGVVDGEADLLHISGYIRDFRMSLSGKEESTDHQLSTYDQRAIYSNEGARPTVASGTGLLIPFSFVISLQSVHLQAAAISA